MPNDVDTRPVPDLLLEQYRLNELLPEDASRVRDAVASDPTVRERLAALEASDTEIRRNFPPFMRDGGRAETTRQRAESNGRLRGWALPLALTAAAATLAFTVPSLLPGTGKRVDGRVATAADRGNRIKGSRPSLAVYRQTDRGSETLADGAVTRPGDVVRLGYAPADRVYGVILSVDTRGTVTQHLPQIGSHAVKLAHDRMNLLDTAYELDDVPGWERFYFVTSDVAFEVPPIADLARRAAGARADRPKELPLSRAFDQFVFLLQKEVRP